MAIDLARLGATYATLMAAGRRLTGGDADFASIERAGFRALEDGGLRPDYFAVRLAADLGSPTVHARELVILTAARLSRARLIDNIRVTRT